MDNLILDGDMVLNQNGEIKTISLNEEIVQQILISLMVKKENFPLMPELGSTLHSLDINSIDDFTLLSVIVEALSSIDKVTVKSLNKVIDYQNQNIEIILYLNIDGVDTDIKINNASWG